ncbi:putative sodium-dependent multivitamin transporter [Uloborus diversus]|uniref:putative sodium-dependent multivitamin transporter n=1 Tax=Uloborus diversus TaxID=327109 RepID=UPI0024093FD8|nr:putative sodium-dependent multivitamin transporter [Uloborus diversus]
MNESSIAATVGETFHRQPPQLGEIDYIVIAVMLLISSGIGVYFRFSGGKQKTTQEFLMAGRDMAVWPVAFSVMASGKSAITYLGVPSDMYVYGTYFAFVNLGNTCGALVAGYLFLPVFFRTRACTTYEYLEKRFGRTLRVICSLSFSIQSMLYIAVILYAPALALSAVTNLTIWMSVVSVGVVCTFYCTLGGMKAVLWTDVFQALLMYGGMVAMVIKGCLDVGGIETVISRAKDGGRLIIPGFEPDFTTRYTFINIFFYGFFTTLSAYGASQMQVQRLLTVRSVHRARCALFSSLPITFVFHVVNCLAGLVVFANFYDCDPLTSGEGVISKPDQLLPYFSLTALGSIPGLPGLCICGMLSAALSTMSSMVNSLTTVTVEDFFRPMCAKRGMTDAYATFVAKLITLVYGGIGLVLTFVVASFGNVLQASTIVYGLVAGPTLGVFLLGVLTSRSNEKGAIIGLVMSLALTAWISFGGAATNVAHPRLPVSVSGCPGSNSTTPLPDFTLAPQYHNKSHYTTDWDVLTEGVATEVSKEYVFPLYRISYMWFTPIGVMATVIFGYLSSLIFCKSASTDEYLLSPIAQKIFGLKPHQTYTDVELTSASALSNGTVTKEELSS